MKPVGENYVRVAEFFGQNFESEFDARSARGDFYNVFPDRFIRGRQFKKQRRGFTLPKIEFVRFSQQFGIRIVFRVNVIVVLFLVEIIVALNLFHAVTHTF